MRACKLRCDSALARSKPLNSKCGASGVERYCDRIKAFAATLFRELTPLSGYHQPNIG